VCAGTLPPRRHPVPRMNIPGALRTGYSSDIAVPGIPRRWISIQRLVRGFSWRATVHLRMPAHHPPQSGASRNRPGRDAGRRRDLHRLRRLPRPLERFITVSRNRSATRTASNCGRWKRPSDSNLRRTALGTSIDIKLPPQHLSGVVAIFNGGYRGTVFSKRLKTWDPERTLFAASAAP